MPPMARSSDMADADDNSGAEEILRTASKAALAIFVDAHNTGYYVNAYTTKLNPTMDGVLKRLLDGMRRLILI